MIDLADLPLFNFGGRTYDATLDEPAMESRRRIEDGIDGRWEYRSNVVMGEQQ